MTGWGERKDRGTGSTGEIETAHEAMDRLGIPGGNLAERVLTLIGRHVGTGDVTSCSHPNPVWWTDSPLWNQVMNGGDSCAEAAGILCPACFAARADAVFDRETSDWRITGWRLTPDWARS